MYVCACLCACIYMHVCFSARLCWREQVQEFVYKIVIKGHLRPLLIEIIEHYNHENDFKVSKTSLLKSSNVIILSHY